MELKMKNEEILNSINELKKIFFTSLKESRTHYILQSKDNSTNKINILSNNYTISTNGGSNMFINFSKNIFTFNNNPIKFFYYENQIFMKAKNIAKILNYENIKQAIKLNVNINDRIRIYNIFNDRLHNISPLARSFLNDKTIFINESGFYSLILGSLNKQEAQYFKQWTISEIFPTIRKNGSYNIINNYIDENLDKYYKKDCVYIIHIVDNIYKYGYSSNLSKRLQHHKNTLKYKKIIKIYEMKNINQIIELEKKIKKLVYSLNINRVLTNENNKDSHVEFFEIDNDNLHNIIRKIDEFSDDTLKIL
jgi:prophage antirepressor-like protein